MYSILDILINKIILLDNEISIKVLDNYIILHKNYSEDCFFEKSISMEDLYKWTGLFGADMTAKDMIKTLDEDIKECYEDD